MTTRQVSCGTGTLLYKRESRSLQNVSAAALAAAFRCSRHGALSIHSITLVSVMRSVVRCCSRSPLIQSISHFFAFSISTQSFMLPLVRCKMNMRTAGEAMVERPLNRRTFVRAAGVTAFTFADAAAAFTQHGAGRAAITAQRMAPAARRLSARPRLTRSRATRRRMTCSRTRRAVHVQRARSRHLMIRAAHVRNANKYVYSICCRCPRPLRPGASWLVNEAARRKCCERTRVPQQVANGRRRGPAGRTREVFTCADDDMGRTRRPWTYEASRGRQYAS